MCSAVVSADSCKAERCISRNHHSIEVRIAQMSSLSAVCTSGQLHVFNFLQVPESDCISALILHRSLIQLPMASTNRLSGHSIMYVWMDVCMDRWMDGICSSLCSAAHSIAKAYTSYQQLPLIVRKSSYECKG